MLQPRLAVFPLTTNVVLSTWQTIDLLATPLCHSRVNQGVRSRCILFLRSKKRERHSSGSSKTPRKDDRRKHTSWETKTHSNTWSQRRWSCSTLSESLYSSTLTFDNAILPACKDFASLKVEGFASLHHVWEICSSSTKLRTSAAWRWQCLTDPPREKLMDSSTVERKCVVDLPQRACLYRYKCTVVKSLSNERSCRKLPNLCKVVWSTGWVLAKEDLFTSFTGCSYLDCSSRHFHGTKGSLPSASCSWPVNVFVFRNLSRELPTLLQGSRRGTRAFFHANQYQKHQGWLARPTLHADYVWILVGNRCKHFVLEIGVSQDVTHPEEWSGIGRLQVSGW